jgi:hypothetical protein
VLDGGRIRRRVNGKLARERSVSLGKCMFWCIQWREACSRLGEWEDRQKKKKGTTFLLEIYRTCLASSDLHCQPQENEEDALLILIYLVN